MSSSRPAPGSQPVIEPEPYESTVVQALVAELMADLDRRYAADGPAAGDSPERVAAHAVRAEQVTPPHGIFLVAWLAGEPVGCGAVRPLRDGPPGVAEIKRMYTVPAARHRGIGRALLARLEGEAAVLGYRRLQLETGRRQPEAVSLYESAGYHRIPSFGQYQGDELSICCAKDLAGG